MSIMDALSAQSSGKRLVTVIDIRADAFRLQETLRVMDFQPTVYYPSLIAGVRARVDGIQYTCLSNCDFEDSLDGVERLEWSPATNVIKAVRGGFLQAPGAIHGVS